MICARAHHPLEDVFWAPVIIRWGVYFGYPSSSVGRCIPHRANRGPLLDGDSAAPSFSPDSTSPTQTTEHAVLQTYRGAFVSLLGGSSRNVLAVMGQLANRTKLHNRRRDLGRCPRASTAPIRLPHRLPPSIPGRPPDFFLLPPMGYGYGPSHTELHWRAAVTSRRGSMGSFNDSVG